LWLNARNDIEQHSQIGKESEKSIRGNERETLSRIGE
jgi:hypothetical protein